MYKYDVCLSKLLRAWEDAAKVLREHEGNAPHGLRLSGSVCLDCFEEDYTDTPLTDVDVDDISKRWQKLGILRDLYLDEAISRDFEKYKVQFVSQGPGYLKPNGIRPIIEESPELAIKSKSDHNYDPDLKARFHQSLCLHSIALATRSHAIYSRDQVQMENDPPNLIGRRLWETAFYLWVKSNIVLNGHHVQLSDHAQFDCLEIFDFLYLFLLEKVVPFSALESWTAEAADRYPYDEDEGHLENWFSLLYHYGLTLQPSDIVDLVKHKSWREESTFPADKTKYMCERGLFDIGLQGAADYHTCFTRLSLIHETRHSLCSGGDNNDQHRSCLWDELRIKLGSPFRPRFWQMLDLETSRVGPAEVRGRGLHGCPWGNVIMSQSDLSV